MLVRAQVAVAAVALGCCEEATAMVAAYTSQREQFGRPLSTNQGVAMRAADCYIDTDCMRVTLLQAAWLIDEGRSAAEIADAAAVPSGGRPMPASGWYTLLSICTVVWGPTSTTPSTATSCGSSSSRTPSAAAAASWPPLAAPWLGRTATSPSSSGRAAL